MPHGGHVATLFTATRTPVKLHYTPVKMVDMRKTSISLLTRESTPDKQTVETSAEIEGKIHAALVELLTNDTTFYTDLRPSWTTPVYEWSFASDQH
jgi:hypothetical protein